MKFTMKSKRMVFRAAVLAVSALMLVGAILFGLSYRNLPEPEKQVPDTYLPAPLLTAGNLLKSNGGKLHTVLVYSRDEYAAQTAEKLALRFSEVEGIRAEVQPDDRYVPEEDVLLTVFVGHTSYSAESYFSAYRRLGAGGWELTRGEYTEGKTTEVYLTAFAAEPLQEAADTFVTDFLFDEEICGPFLVENRAEPSHIDGELPALLSMGSFYRTCAAAYPGTDGYSLRALETLTAECAPNSLYFWGVPDLGADRDSIGESWSKVLDSVITLAGRVDVLPMETAMGAEHPGITSDVLLSLLGEESRVLEGINCRYVLDNRGEPLAAEYFVTGTEEETLSSAMAMIEQYSSLVLRATGGKVAQIVYLPAIPTAVAAQMPTTFDYAKDQAGLTFCEPYGDFVSSSADAVFSTAIACGVRTFVFQAGYTNMGVMTAEVGGQPLEIGFCGSIGFQNPGVGGKFALNNSLRGLLCWQVKRDGTASLQTKMEYVRAAAYGLTEKNAE